MKTKTIDAFTYAELSDEAKTRARDWYRDACAGDCGSLDYVLEDAANIAPLLGIEFDTRPVKLMGGATRYDPDISYRVAWSQGDGAEFSGTWRAENFPKTKKGRPRACPVKDHAPKDEKLARVCRELSRIARAFPDLVAVAKSHHYYGMQFEFQSGARDAAEYPDTGDRDAARVAQFEQAEKDLKEALRDFAHWIYCSLRDELEYQNSDAAVTEAIEGNEYLFTAEGSREVTL